MRKIVVVAVALLILAGLAFFLLRPAAQPPAPPRQEIPVPQRPADAPLPPAADSDAQVRKALAGVSPRPELSRWLADSDLLDRWTVVADNLAEDVSPRKELAFLAPAKPFKAVEIDGATRIDERSYQRYDSFAEVVASVDATVFADAVRALHPLLEASYHRLGYPDRKLDDLAQKALQRLVGAPVAEGAVQLVPKGGIYKFADDKLESQGPVEKHLLRMGPRNARLIQAKARELAAALR